MERIIIWTIVFISSIQIGTCQWVLNNNADNDLVYSKIFYTSKDTLWALGRENKTSPNYYCVTSYDGGKSFNYILNPFNPFINLIPFDGNHALAYGAQPITPGNRYFALTSDGGQNWNPVSISDSTPKVGNFGLLPLYQNHVAVMFNNSSGFDCQQIYKSSNKGLTWTKIPCENIHYNNLQFGSIRKVYSSGSYTMLMADSLFIYTPDNGSNWYMREGYNTHLFYASLTFMDTMNVVWNLSSSLQTIMYRSNNGGLSWDTVKQGFSDMRVALYVKDSNDKGFFFMGGPYNSIISSDTGKSWSILDNENHRDVAFFDTQNGISVNPVSAGGKGVMLFTGFPSGLPSSHSNLTFKLFPNPNNGNFSIAFGEEFNSKSIYIQVTNLLGQIVYTSSSNLMQGDEHNINLDFLDNGLYNISFVTDKSDVIRSSLVISK